MADTKSQVEADKWIRENELTSSVSENTWSEKSTANAPIQGMCAHHHHDEKDEDDDDSGNFGAGNVGREIMRFRWQQLLLTNQRFAYRLQIIYVIPSIMCKGWLSA